MYGVPSVSTYNAWEDTVVWWMEHETGSQGLGSPLYSDHGYLGAHRLVTPCCDPHFLHVQNKDVGNT